MITDISENSHVDPIEEELMASEEASSFADMLDDYEYSRPQRGRIIRGTIIRVEDDAIFLDVGAKRDAIVPRNDLDRLDKEMVDGLERGMELPVYVLTSPEGDEDLLVSINKGLEQEDWERAEQLMEEEATVDLEVVGYNKGGLIVQFSQLQGFVPNSHVPDLRYGGGQTAVESRKARMMGETLLLKVLEVDQNRRRLILSAKAAHKEHRQRTLEELESGSVVEGRVANIVKYGAFVDLGGGVSGLLHVSEMAWHRVDHPSEVLNVGEDIEVQIQDVDVDRERVSLSRKAVLPNPWDTVEERYNIGDLVEGRVTNVEDFGAFVEVQSGVVGLVHVSEIDVFGPAKITDVVHDGDQVLVRIIDMEPAEERLSLSLRRVTPEEQIEWMQRQRTETAEEDALEEETSAAADVEDSPAGEAELPQMEAEVADAVEVESEGDGAGVTGSDGEEPDVVDMESAGPDLEMQSDEPDVVEMEGAEPDSGESEGEEPDVVEMEGAEPDTVESEGEEPGVVEMEGAEPDTGEIESVEAEIDDEGDGETA
jgi:small subunit ribosomal protein S1